MDGNIHKHYTTPFFPIIRNNNEKQFVKLTLLKQLKWGKNIQRKYSPLYTPSPLKTIL